MILKYYQINSGDLKNNKIFLFYGNNDGHKNEVIQNLTQYNKNRISYEESEILDKSKNFIESLLNKSLFEKEKIIIIKRVTDKIIRLVEEIEKKNISDILIILNANHLEKKSKLRSFFEKDKKYLCVAFYPDNEETLSKLAYNFLSKRKISLSPSNVNFIVRRSNGSRETLLNELIKIESFAMTKKNLDTYDLIKLTNLTEDHSISELIDNCLAKNTKKTIGILNENNFNNEDCILITRIFLNKSKKILQLSEEFRTNKNLDLTISKAKPPIFWKDKEITKQQISKWDPENIKKLIYKLNEIELSVKKNVDNSIHLITDFILEQLSTKSNN